MRVKEELPVIIDGVKSWLRCDRRIKNECDKSLDYYYHFHDYIELLYALDADCEIWINGKCYSFVTGDFAVINSNEPHYVFANKKSEYICIHISPDILYSDENAFLEYKTGQRTYDASLILKEFGADNIVADSFLKEEFEEYALKIAQKKIERQLSNPTIISKKVLKKNVKNSKIIVDVFVSVEEDIVKYQDISAVDIEKINQEEE